MLFAIAGFVYDQTHTRNIPDYGGLAKNMPFIAGVFIVAVAASFGLPGTVNFVGELMVIVGSWDAYPVQTVIAVLGIAITMFYLMRMLKNIFVRDASPVIDRLPLLIMVSCTVFYGIFPSHFIEVIKAGVYPLLALINGPGTMISQGGGF
jgi:NADH-quinone oxidoreductase subunit M